MEGAHILPAHACFRLQSIASIYANLWHSTIRRRQTDTNIVFYSYFQFITKVVKSTVRILEEAIITYRNFAWFRAGMHHLNVQSKKDIAGPKLPTNYRLTVEEVHSITNDWEDDWKNLTEKYRVLLGGQIPRKK
jgi:hypothetical protein